MMNLIPMITKKKICSGCKLEQYIWKTIGRERYCKSCAGRITPTKAISNKSSKKGGEDQVYSKLRKDYLTLYPVCKAKIPGCTSTATDIHHKAGRGKYYLITTTWISVCRSCHNWITEHSKEAIELGFSTSRLNINLEE